MLSGAAKENTLLALQAKLKTEIEQRQLAQQEVSAKDEALKNAQQYMQQQHDQWADAEQKLRERTVTLEAQLTAQQQVCCIPPTPSLPPSFFLCA